jgi:hypothetical protein
MFSSLVLSIGVACGWVDDDVTVRQPTAIRQTVIAASKDHAERPYLAFPAIVDLGDEVLVSFKQGRSHAQDTDATLDLIRIDPQSGRAIGPTTLARLDGHILQMGEWLRFPNGDLASFIDTQIAGKSTTRVGLYAVRSTDGGRTFGEPHKVGVQDGVEYGYAFDAITEGQTTWLLAMTFSNLTGGKSVYPPRPHAGAVHVIRTDDNGRSWRFGRDLSHEFGDVPINESTFLRHGDGWLVTTRGYDDRQRLHRTSADFRVEHQANLTAKHAVIGSHLGRPRMFVRDGGVYLLGRNWTPPPKVMQLALFRLDPMTLSVTTMTILDNAERANVVDGYYAMPYFRGAGDDARLFVVDYKRPAGQPGPDIVLHEFRWGDVR